MQSNSGVDEAQSADLKNIVEDVCMPNGCPSAGNGTSQTLERTVAPDRSLQPQQDSSFGGWQWVFAGAGVTTIIILSVVIWHLHAHLGRLKKKRSRGVR